jgi:WD40 repeat protein
METFGDLTKVAFSADDKVLAASRLFTSSEKLQLNEVRVWDVATGTPKFVFDRCHAFCFAPRGNAIAVVSRRRCLVYDLTTGDKLNEYPDLANALSIQYSPGGERLAGVVARSTGFELRACDVAGAAPPVIATPLSAPFYSVVFSPDGLWLASGHAAGEVWLWDARTLQPLSRFQSGGRGLQHPFFSPDGSLLAAGDQLNGDVVFWEPSSGAEVRRYTFEKGAFHTYRMRATEELVAPERDPARFVFAPDGQAFLAGPHGGIIREIANGQDTHRFGD